MKPLRILIPLMCFSCHFAVADDPPRTATAEPKRELWYDHPGNNWEAQALPLGNGPMGCMVFGGIDKERLQFNVDSLWTGDENMVGKERGKSKDASYLAPGMGFYQNFGSLYLEVKGTGKTTGYRRALDLDRAVHTVTYTRDGVRFTRETFCSHPAMVAIMRLTADQPGKYSGRLLLEDAHEAQTVAKDAGLTAAGALDNGMKYESQVRLLHQGGKVTAADGALVFEDCDSLLLVLAADTNYVMNRAKGWMDGDPHQRVTARADAVAAADYDKLLAAHIADHQGLFRRVGLDVGATDPAQLALPTNKRIDARKNGAKDPDLTELLFQHGRYLLIACSRPGSLPANLQGVWNHSNEPPWHCDYHTNINVQMNYWLAEPANLGECAVPLFDLFSSGIPVHREACRIRFGDLPGFTFQTVYNVFNGTGWEWNMVGSAWIAQHFWEHFAFSRDLDYLRETAYPYMKQVCEFWQARLKELPDGRLVVPEGWSPEHGPREDGVSFDQQIVWDLFSNTIEATEALGVDADLRARLADMRKRLVGPQVGKWGQLQEWMTDRDDPKNDHRHTSHLFAVYPGRQISRAETPEFAKAAAVSLEARGQTGDARRSWTWPWRCAIWARLGQGDKSGEMIDGLFAHNLLPNMFATHPPFQIDGNLGITAGICEMLVQSHAGRIELLPALPAAWPDGKVTGLRARGGFEVDVAWAEGRVTSARIRSKTGGKAVVLINDRIREMVVPAGGEVELKPDGFLKSNGQVPGGPESIRVVDRPDPAGGNDHYTVNRTPLLPSRFIELPPGAIEPRGWLRRQLQLQAEGFHGRLDEISPYLRKEGNAWLAADGRGKHGWEELPYWLKGYGNLAYILGEETMIAEAKVWIEGAIRSQQPDGWFGPDHSRKGGATSLQGRDDLWPNMIMLFCLQDYHEFTRDERVPAMMTRYFRYLHEKVPPDRLLNGYWPVMRGGDLLHSIHWLFNRTGDSWLLELAEKVHADTARWDEKIVDWHNVNFAQGFGEPATWHLQSLDPEDLEAAYRNFREMRKLYGQVPGGMFGADENARPGYTGPRQAIETCGIVEQMLSNETLLRISGDPFWADHCETVAFNTFPAALTSDLKSLRYLTAPNQVLSDAVEKKPAVHIHSPVFLYSPHKHRCCQHNWGHGWPYFVRHLWLAAPGNGLAVGMYGASKVTAKVGNGQTVSIVETTRYPFRETVTLKIEAQRPATFPLYLRIPAWCDAARVELNGKPAGVQPAGGKYVVMQREWSDGDEVALTFPMDLRVKCWTDNHGSVSVDRGPLTYSLKIGEKRVRHGGSEEWPEWEIHPATPWNYGLVLDEANPVGSFEVRLRDWPESDTPFAQECVPIEIVARARRIPEWRLEEPGMVGRMQDSPVKSDEPIESVTLIPMGAARLRISAFPVVGTGADLEHWK